MRKFLIDNAKKYRKKHSEKSIFPSKKTPAVYQIFTQTQGPALTGRAEFIKFVQKHFSSGLEKNTVSEEL